MPALPKETLRNLLADARTDEALVRLLGLLAEAPDFHPLYRELIALRGQLTSADSNYHLTLIDFREYSRETTRINFAVMSCLDRLPDEIAPARRKKNAAPETALLHTAESLAADTAWEYDLFFSFSSHDLDAARAFCLTLRGYGLRVFFSADDLRHRAGQNFGDLIEKALHASRDFVLFCSPAAMQSGWVKLERETFFQQYHLPQAESRRFHIAEGPAFTEALVPAFYRRYQRLRAAEDLLASLAPLAPGRVVEAPKAPSPPVAEKMPDPPKAAAPDEHAWEFTVDAGTRAAFEKYLARFPQGFYAGEARARIDAFEADDTAWEFASEAGTEKALQKYLQKFPEGRYATEAWERVVALEGKKETELARRKQEQEEVERRLSDPFHDLMVLVKGGTFEMGDLFGEGYENEKPVHKVTLSDFYLCKYPVTQGQWKAVMGNNPSYFTGNDLLPVEHVSWDDVQDFIQKLNEKTGLRYRLPTEAEWEYAAREGGKKVRFGNGKDIADPAEMNFCGREEYKELYSVAGEWRQCTTPVDRFPPNALGLHDMSGNVWEWCQDWYDAAYYGQSAGAKDPRGPEKGEYRVCRGGSWDLNPEGCRAADRSGDQAGYRDYYLGFRVARGY